MSRQKPADAGRSSTHITGLRMRGRSPGRRPTHLRIPAAGLATGRSFVTETRQDPDLRRSGVDVQSITDALIAHAAASGGHLTSAEVGVRLEEAQVTSAQAKKVVRALTEAGVLVFDGSASTSRPKVVAARARTAYSAASTGQVAVDDH